MTTALRRNLRLGLVTAVVAYAALLRFDAISQQYDAVATPRWLSVLQRSRAGPSVLRPSAVQWTAWPLFPHREGPPTQYRSDPYTYLQRARQMHSFYEAHLREPLFPFTTKIALWLLDNQDVAVSAASAWFSILAVFGTFVLGAMAFSDAIGLGAALLLAVEYEVITVGTQGWRDDAFTAAVVWCSVAVIAFARRPSRGRAILLGALAAAACLVRITAISFLVPAWLWIAWTANADLRLRVGHLAFGTVIAVALVTPYLVNCWSAFGDPFYSINAHAAAYQVTENPSDAMPSSAAEYLTSHVIRRPFRTIDTAAMGMTAYPFSNKWVGFDPWGRRIGLVLSWTSLAGLTLFTLRST
ncbi:MAG TPA: glycosyltransferase family 39 protein, partial [Vicinamibacterales bacterium]|nr:glycosyltransferase family 39 protein [Vicinamibacterales bacterium]